ncbi:DnaK suppressor protein [Lentzea fradiae]|uniref:DnaK suppressor protein n=1 Tax=Lentzea fradiae TaxID=200378 RepID=A0A1G7KV68_9PSEU|nr:hypothetical protein [Lentzea fradiae]SDF41158.1 DnaK suppressor protein [Lentzea fradiae]
MTAGLVLPAAPRDDLTTLLPVLRRRLEEERAFRLDQLAELDVTDPGDAARREVAELVAAGAAIALEDIEIALLRMDIGSYGRCHTCHAEISVRLLEAIPQTRSCGAHWRTEEEALAGSRP